MNYRYKILGLLFFLSLVSATGASAKKLQYNSYKLEIAVPDAMMEVQDTSVGANGQVYYDTLAGIVLIVTGNQSNFSSVKDYLDCSREKLEQQMKYNYDDTSLVLINCAQSKYYPKEITELEFTVSILPSGFDTHLIYFIHHKKMDIQLSFAFRKETEVDALKYINKAMETLALK